MKLHIGCGNDIIEGYDNLDSEPKSFDVKKVNYISLPYDGNNAKDIIIRYAINQIEISQLDRFFAELDRVSASNCELTIHFVDIINLINKFKNNLISVEELNYAIYGKNNFTSAVSKQTIIDLLNKYNFEMIGFEFEDNSSWDDYKCIIKAKSKKIGTPKSTQIPLTESDDEIDIFEGINFDFDDVIKNTQQDDSGFDINLLDEVISTNKHADTLDYDLLSEVIDFSVDTSDKRVFSTPTKSKVEDNELLNEIMNFNFETISRPEASKSLFDEVMNFDVSEKTEKEKTYNNSHDDLNKWNFEPQNLKAEKNSLFNSSEDIQPQLNIVWEGSQFVYNPLALVNREICSVLIKSNTANVTIVPYEPDDVNFDKFDTDKALLDNDIRRKKEVPQHIAKLPYAWIRNQNPAKSEPPKGAKWIVMQAWEYPVLTKEALQVLNRADEIWTPSFYSRKSLVDSGIDFNKVQVIPYGINPKVFTPFGNKYPLHSNKKLKFLYVGGTIYRKGFDILLETFTNQFTSDDDVCLVVKENGSKTFNSGKTSENQIKLYKQRYNAPEIIYIEDNLTEFEMASLYRSCDVIISPYRMESFPLALLEGMACGLPVVATRGGAADDFLEEAFTYFINSETKSVGTHFDDLEFVSNIHIAEPSKIELSDIMLGLYNNPSDIKSMGAIASAFARTKYTWKNSTIKALRRLDYLYGTKMSSVAENVLEDYYDESIIFGTAEHSYIEGDFDDAVNLYMKAIKGNVPDVYKILGMHRIALILINRNDQNSAYEILDSASILDFDNPDTIYIKSIIKASLSQHVEALEIISPLMDEWKSFKYNSHLGNNLDDIVVLTADLLLAIDDLEAAHSLYSTALSINENNAFACYGAGMCFKLSNLDSDAKTMFEWATKINPDFEDAQKELDLLR